MPRMDAKLKTKTPYLADKSMMWWHIKHSDIERGIFRLRREDFKE